jgi:hypothetical protein
MQKLIPPSPQNAMNKMNEIVLTEHVSPFTEQMTFGVDEKNND